MDADSPHHRVKIARRNTNWRPCFLPAYDDVTLSPKLSSRARARPVPAVAAGVSTGAVTHIDIVVNYGVDANSCVARIDKNGRVA